MRSIGMDVHRSFAQVAVLDRGKVTEEFRVDLDYDAVVSFGQKLRKDDEVILEATGNTSAIVRLLTPFVAKVVIANPLQVKAIAHARVKTDKVDARILAQLHAAGFLPEVWAADDDTLNLRRLVSERAALVRSVRRVKSRVQAVLHANLVPKYSGHLFGKDGRDWLSKAPLPKAERDLLARHLDELDWLKGKLEKLDGAMARIALDDWLKCWHPDVLCIGLLNSQPMGFYAPAQIVRDARDHGVEVRPICANASRWDCTLESTRDEGRFAVRLGLRMVKGFSNAHAARLVTARAGAAFTSIDDLWQRAGVPIAALTQIAEADGFHPCFRLGRREALWALKGLRDEPLPLFAAASAREARTVHELAEPDVALRPLAAGGEVVEDYRHAGLSLRDHPVTFLRAELSRRRIVTCREAMDARDGRWLEAAGLVLVRQRPGSAKGVMFITLEDESGIANLVVWPKVFEANRRTILSAGMIAVRGRVQREGEVVHLVAQRLTDLSQELASVAERGGAFPLPHGRGDEFHHGSPTPDPRGEPRKGLGTRDIYIRNLHLDTIKVKTRDFR